MKYFYPKDVDVIIENGERVAYVKVVFRDGKAYTKSGEDVTDMFKELK